MKHLLPRRAAMAAALSVAIMRPGLAEEDDLVPRGAPRGRIGGATRGPHSARDGAGLDLAAPASRDAILVATPSPTLYYVTAAATPVPLRFALAQRDEPMPLGVRDLPPAAGPGLHAVPLAALGLRLPPGRDLIWSVTLPVDEANPSADLVAVALVRHAPPAPDWPGRLGQGPARRAALVAAGYWYEAFAEAAAAGDAEGLRSLAAAEGLTLPR